MKTFILSTILGVTFGVLIVVGCGSTNEVPTYDEIVEEVYTDSEVKALNNAGSDYYQKVMKDTETE